MRNARLTLLLGGLVLAGAAGARSMQDHDHGKHEGDHKDMAKMEETGGDPYLLTTDAMSGKALGPIGKQVVLNHEGRELRFSGEKTAAEFKKNPDKYLAAVDKKMIAQQLPFYPLETCVVSGEALEGDMGGPVDVLHKNRLVRLCCKGCKRDLAKNPAAFLAKIDKAVIAKQGKDYPLNTCVVSGEKLGGMGDPVDVVVGNRLVRLCCKGCTKKVTKDPLTYLAKLDKSVKSGTVSSAKGDGSEGASEGGGCGGGSGSGSGSGCGDGSEGSRR